ncbi:MAG TPA: efflux RND transporter periplasmic adaptor subunit [candidate division Zixibacteria bacterium]|nr:efflux RND transporter periplasmic adaptor subunit [candidate division Zixibacteria bacterium]
MSLREDTAREIEEVLRLDEAPRRRRYAKAAAVLLLVLAGVVAAARYFADRRSTAVRYRTAPVVRGDLTVVVTATGTVQPVNQVEVGTEISGTIRTVEVDYNDRVVVGQVLARLDTDKLQAQVLQSQSTLESMQARLIEAQATVAEARDNLERFKRVREMSGGKVPSEREFAAAEAALKRALALEATLRAQVSEARWKLDIDRTNLSKAVIRSPINGVVLKRQVEPGQTVTASLQTPVLFTIAENLAQMEVQVDVDEADVAHVRDGQEAFFTVDGYPGRIFKAVVKQVRYGPETVQGVVTYKTLLSVDNTDLALRPGMTATANITVKKLADVLLAPNAALRFSPPPVEEAAPAGSLLGRLFPRPPRERRREPADLKSRQQRLWVLRDGELAAVPVTTGSTDGVMTEIVGGEIAPGTQVVVDVIKAGS